MKQTETHSKTVIWRSDKRPEIHTTNPALVSIIEWADTHPCAWDVVTQTQSKAFGRYSCEYIGWAQGSLAPESVLERVRHLHDLAASRDSFQGPESIFAWRAQFTLEHYRDAGFDGGLFRQHDGKYHRHCLVMDYTPDTMEEVVTRFIEWCGRDQSTAYVTLNCELLPLPIPNEPQ